MTDSTFQTIDGGYKSQIFPDMIEAQADAEICREDENYSGCVYIVEIADDVKTVVMVWDDQPGYNSIYVGQVM